MTAKYTISLDLIDDIDKSSAGNKAHSLARLKQSGFPIPDGFALTSDAFQLFLSENNLQEKIHSILSELDSSNPEDLLLKSRQIKDSVLNTAFPGKLKDALIYSYSNLFVNSQRNKSGLSKILSKVSSPTEKLIIHEDGLSELEVIGEANLADSVRSLWADHFSPKFLKETHRPKGHLVVQLSTTSNQKIIFRSANEDLKEKNKIFISHDTDLYEVYRNDTNRIEAVALRGNKLSRVLLNSLIDTFLKLEKYHFFPIETHFALDGEKILITKIKPLTNFNNTQTITDKSDHPVEIIKHTVYKGSPYSKGLKRAPLKFAKDHIEAGRKVKYGDIIVVTETDNSFLPSLSKVSGILTIKGNKLSHAAVFGKKMGIPTIVVEQTLLKNLRDGHVVTINGSTGEVIR